MKRLPILFASALLLAVPAACGGDDEKDTGAQTTTPSGALTETLDVTLTDFAIDPANPRVPKPGAVEIRATNRGEADHTLEVEGPKGEQVLKPTLGPGESGAVRVALDEPGRYEWYCPIGNHRDLGMEGEIRVGSGGSNTTGENTTGENTTGENTTGEDQSDDSGSGSGGGGY